MRKKGLFLMVLLAVLVFAGCRTLDVKAVTSDVSVEMNNSEGKEIIGSFARKWKNHILFWNILTLSQDKTSQIIEEAVAELGGSGAVNVRVRKQLRFFDYILTSITAGLYSPETIFVKGEVVK